MSATLFTAGKFRAFDAAGAPLSGGLLYSYVAGTTTPKNTYTDQSGSIANANPVVLDSTGQANVWLTGNYQFVLKDSNGVTQWTEDNISDTIFSDAFFGTSTTNLSIATGSKAITTQSGKAWTEGQYLIVASDALATNYMVGQVTSYSGTLLTLLVTGTGGSGTYADWNISLSGTPGPTGPAGGGGGGSGNVTGPGSSTDGYIALFNGSSGQLLKQWTSGPGSAAALDAGTSALQVVQLDASAKIPALDGSQVTLLNASNLGSGTVPTARLGSGTANSTTFLRGDSTWSSATAPTTLGAVGTYILAVQVGGTQRATGATTAAANLSYASSNYAAPSAGAWGSSSGPSSGTWQNMGGTTNDKNGAFQPNVSLWVRTV